VPEDADLILGRFADAIIGEIAVLSPCQLHLLAGSSTAGHAIGEC
jgi:hypothetical protein